MIKTILNTKSINLDSIIEHIRTPLFRNGYALIVSTGLTSVLGLVYWAIAARVYATDTVGLNSTAISAMIFLSGIAQINLQEMTIRFIPQAGKRTLRLVLSAYSVVILISVIVGLIFCLGISVWSPALSFLTSSSASIAWFVFALVLWGIFVIQDSVLTGLRQAIWIPIENAVFSISKIVLLIILAATFPSRGIFISWTVAVAAIILPVNILIFKRLIHIHSLQAPATTASFSLRQISKYVAANYIAALLANMSSALLPILIVQIIGATANAHFYIAWVIASSLQIVTANMATSLTVEGSIDQEKLDEHKRRATIGIARIVIPAALLLFIGAPVILQLMGESYRDEATLLMRLLAFAAIPNIFNMVYVGLSRVQNRMRGIVGIYAANALIVLSLSILFMKPFGITGVGLAWLISQTSIALVVLLLPKMRGWVPSNQNEGLSYD